MKWKALPPMPKPDSHIEFAWVIVNNSLVIVGGTTDKHPITKRMVLVGEVFQFNLVTLVRNSFLHPLIVVMYDARRIIIHFRFQICVWNQKEKTITTTIEFNYAELKISKPNSVRIDGIPQNFWIKIPRPLSFPHLSSSSPSAVILLVATHIVCCNKNK